MVRAASFVLAGVGLLVEPAFAATLNLAHTPETIYAYPTAFGAIDPIAMVDCFEGLVAMDARGNAIPGQASSWTISPDGLTYTFTLREGIAWSNGDPVVAADFLASFRWLLDPANAFEFAYLQFPIRNAAAVAAGNAPLDDLGVTVLDERTLEIVLEAPAPYFLQALTHSTAYPIPSSFQEELGRKRLSRDDLVCNGPYVVTRQDEGITTAVKSASYYDRANVKIDAVNYFAIRDVPAGLEQFRAGGIDMFYDLPISANAWIEANAPNQSNVVSFLGLSYLSINLEKPPLDQQALRRALSMALDRSLLDPQGVHSPKSVAYGLVPPGTSNYDGVQEYRPEWADWPYEKRLSEAAAVLASFGYTPENPLVIQVRYNGDVSDMHQKAVRDIAAMWSRIGVKVELFPAAPAAHFAALRTGDFDMGVLTWILDYSDPANILELMQTRSEFNTGRYHSPELDTVLAEAATETDLSGRAFLLSRAERRIVEDQAIIPLRWVVVRNLLAPGITGIEDNAKNVHPTRWLGK